MNILTFDVEEWFHLLDCDDTRSENEWKSFDVRIHENIERIFRILEETNTKATFFIIGWIAKTYPDVVKRISEKYQIGCHTMNHQLVHHQTKNEFRQDVEAGIKILEDITGKKIESFRAPGFSVRESEAWVYEILYENGIKYDCSVFPAHHAHGGMPSFPKSQPSIIEYNGIQIKEFPVSYKKILGQNIMFSGGGYFRLFPYNLIKSWTKDSENYNMVYIHPRDLDAKQPIIKSLPLSRKFKSYVGLSGAEKKLRKYLSDFDFVDILDADKNIDWTKVDIVHL